MDKKVILLDVDNTAFRKVLVLETLKKNPKLALKVFLKKPTFYIYGGLYKFFGMDGLRKRFSDAMRAIPVADFDVKDMDPEYLKILRLAQWQGHKVVFLTSNPHSIARKWEERIRNMFPRLDFEVRSVPTLEEKIRIAHDFLERFGEKNVHFFDDSLPTVPRLGSPFSQVQMEMDKAVLLREHDNVARTRKDPFDAFQHIGQRSDGLSQPSRGSHLSGRDTHMRSRWKDLSRWPLLRRRRRK